jgi:hypothetical protein
MAELAWLKKWFENRAAELSSAGIAFSCSVERTDTDNPASTFHLEGARWLANVSLWESGACDFESMEMKASPAPPVFEHRQIQSEEDLDALLSQLFHL